MLPPVPRISNMTEQEYEQLQAELYKQFPNSPFDIDCIKNLKELDEPFTQHAGIIIKDDRASPNNYYYDGLQEEERKQYINYMGISKTNTPIALRQVLNAMISNPHYNNDIVKNDFHCILEGFDISSNGIVFTPFFAS
jgi:hypothetical protein